MNDKKIEYLIEGISKDTIAYLLAANGMKMSDASSVFHKSGTFPKLSDPNTGLYIESSAYVYEILKSELKMGKITQE